jgi:hypothetical protein
MSKRPIWVSDAEAEVLLGYVGEALDDKNNISDFDRKVLGDVYAQLDSQEQTDERGYCYFCSTNLDDDQYDYRFDLPVCIPCGEKIDQVADGLNTSEEQ